MKTGVALCYKNNNQSTRSERQTRRGAQMHWFCHVGSQWPPRCAPSCSTSSQPTWCAARGACVSQSPRVWGRVGPMGCRSGGGRKEGLLASPVSRTREVILDAVQMSLCPEQWGNSKALRFLHHKYQRKYLHLIHCIFKLFSGHLEYSNFAWTWGNVKAKHSKGKHLFQETFLFHGQFKQEHPQVSGKVNQLVKTELVRK